VKTYKWMFWVVFGLVIINGCKKKPFNYRNKYVGDWEFTVEITEVNTDSLGYYYHDTISYVGEIYYGNEDDELLITYTDKNSITLKIDREEILSGFPTKYSSGAFDGNEKIKLYLRWGGLGGGITHSISGVKK